MLPSTTAFLLRSLSFTVDMILYPASPTGNGEQGLRNCAYPVCPSGIYVACADVKNVWVVSTVPFCGIQFMGTISTIFIANFSSVAVAVSTV